MSETTHADIACQLAATLPPGVFGRAVRDGIVHHDYATLLTMFPGMQFSHRKVGPDTWELTGVGEDGSTAVWGVGA